MTPAKMTDEELGKRFREIIKTNESKVTYNADILNSLRVRWRAMYDLIKEVK